MYIQKIQKGSKLFHFTEKEVIDFAQRIVDYYKEFVPEVIIQGIVRVDIMEDDENNLLVNELESLAANISCQRDCELNKYNYFKSLVTLIFIKILLLIVLETYYQEQL
jgi:hypothetical protein